jgi:hypothetical protein
VQYCGVPKHKIMHLKGVTKDTWLCYQRDVIGHLHARTTTRNSHVIRGSVLISEVVEGQGRIKTCTDETGYLVMYIDN